MLDGVYVSAAEGGPLVFHALPTPTRAKVADVARRTAERIEKILKANGRLLDPQIQQEPPAGALEVEQPGLAACYAAAARGLLVTAERAGQPPLRLVVSQDPPPSGRDDDAADKPAAGVRGINVHAKRLVDGRDRPQLKRLIEQVLGRPHRPHCSVGCRPAAAAAPTPSSQAKISAPAHACASYDAIAALRGSEFVYEGLSAAASSPKTSM